MLEHLERRLAQMVSRSRSDEAPDPAVLAADPPARLVEVAGRRKRPMTPAIDVRLRGIAGRRGWDELAPAEAVGASLLALTRRWREEGRWDRDQALRFEAAEILAGLEALAALAELAEPTSAAARFAAGWYGARMAARVRRLAHRGGAGTADLDEAERRLLSLAEEARGPLRREIEHG